MIEDFKNAAYNYFHMYFFAVTDNIPVVLSAMEVYKNTSESCIQFIERTTEENYVLFTK